MEFGQRLKSLRLEQGKTQQDLASGIGVSVVAVRNWEHGDKKPSLNALISLSRELGTSIDSMLGLSGQFKQADIALPPEEKTLLGQYRSLDQYGKRAVNTICAIEKERMDALAATKNPCKVINIAKAKRPKNRYMPHYTSAAAAGINTPLDGADFEMMVVNDSIPFNADYAVDIHGSSMEPYIHDGDMVFVDKDAELSIGDVGIFCVDGAMYCKQYYLDGEGNLVLVSANKSMRHTNIFISANSGRSVQACGKVLLDCHVELPDYLLEET